MKVSVGQIYEVKTDCFFTSDKNEVKRQIKINKGEKLEIRYPYEWHFRTERNEYFHCSESDLLDHCTLVGEVLDHVRFTNKARLEEIIRLDLYKKVKETT